MRVQSASLLWLLCRYTSRSRGSCIHHGLTTLQLAQKAIKDRLTRILVILGACAGICYNALWYFPVLIIVGGIVTVLWDTWLAQKVGKLKAKWETKRRRARDEAGDAEETIAPENTQPTQQLQIRRPEAVKRRVQASSSTGRIAPEEGDPGSGRADSQRSTEHDTTLGPAPVADVKTHNISVKLGVSLIIGFFSKLNQQLLNSQLTLRSILLSDDDHPWNHRQPNLVFRSFL